ncbi:MULTISPECIES: hypothetical protein [Methylomonas]|nr:MULTISPECIES: hypothetical protein [Methylomonas]TCV84027.1 hypothetical protein EDE11_108159 [Methylomonas methanica]
MRFRIPAWESLRRIGQSKAMSLTILVPFLGYMILFNEQLVHFFQLSVQLVPESVDVGRVSQATKIRLYYFYFGLTFLGIGSLLYQLFCPSLIKEHGSDRQFVRDEVQLMTVRRARNIIRYLCSRDNIHLQSLGEIESRIEEVAKMGGKLEEAKAMERPATDLMLMQWQSENWQALIARMGVFIFYIAGFAVLSIPSVQMFIKVLAAFINGLQE